MKVVILGSGGREHTLAHVLARSHDVKQVYVIPGNGGTHAAFMNANIALAAPKFTALISFLREKSIDLVVVGPEQYLCAGVVDAVQAAGILIFGPTQAAARLESSKIFAKNIMLAAGIPTAAYEIFTDSAAAQAYLKQVAYPIVLKADGLCAGKGVLIAPTQALAYQALAIFWQEKRFGKAAEQILIEEHLVGPELSVIGVSDGETVRTFLPAQDYKRLNDNDAGPNTGGMGAYTPVSFVTQELIYKIEETVFLPVIRLLKARGTPFKGFLYAGLLKDRKKGYQVLEFNVRLGDPECQCILPLLEEDLLAVLRAALAGKLASLPRNVLHTTTAQAALTVIMASGGYPNAYKTGYPITGLGAVRESMVFHAGTAYDAANKTFTSNGGRVLALTAQAPTLAVAKQRVYNDIKRITFKDCHFRRDIGLLH